MLFHMAASPAYISFHVVWSSPHTSESVSRCDPPILSILILHLLMDLVAAAQLIFPVVCTDASLLSNCSAHVTEMLLCCSAFASLDQKSPVALLLCKMFINNRKSQNTRSLWVPILGPRLHPLYGIGGVQFAISRVPVYTAISNFWISCSERFRVGVACNWLIPVYLGGMKAHCYG